MYRCEDCGSEFDEPLVITVAETEFWGAPVEETRQVCPECKSPAYQSFIANFNRTTKLGGDGKWHDIKFEDIQMGDVVKMYIDGNVVEEGTVMVMSNLYYELNEPMFDCRILSEEDINKIMEAYNE